ncbi:protein kinase [Acidicapsa dinghuensis]|uniref:Protein kinase n=1 Tax=Acidicapsa dinghuensis TaxID=2218256 RepID=A0ABW1EH31_9BACT|nr:protein kinase [Acidicapsa dinghuensis]
MGSRRKTVFRTAFDTYTAQAELGKGPSGAVFDAVDDCGQPCAVKLLNPALTGPSALKRAADELRFCSRRPHKNILPILDRGLHGTKGAFYVAPLYARSLREAIDEGIPQENVLRLFGQILDGVEAAHLYEICHGDLKPENILLSEDARDVVVADFGMKHFLRTERQPADTPQAQGANPFPYVAPEEPHEVTGKADVFALGIMLHEMFTRTSATGPGDLEIADVAPEFAYLDWTVKRMTHPDPKQRLTVTEVKRELIARGNEFLCLQRLNVLKNEILLETEVDDPLLRDPVGLQSVDFRADTLYLTLNQAPPADWVAAFHGSGRPFHLNGYGPERFVFMGRLAHLRVARGVDPQQLLDQAKAYVTAANQAYAEGARARHRAHLEQERELKRAQIAMEERRHEVLSRLRL